jgi:hypothetical protein
MADAKPLPGFGEVDLDIGDRSVAVPSPFGQVDVDVPEPSDPAPPPASSARASIHDDSTRVVKGDALSALTRATPPPPRDASGGATRMASIDESLLEAARTGAEPESLPPASVPSKSGVATRDEVAMMRELYAKGDATGALMVAASLAPEAPEIRFAADHPDASIAIEVGPEIEIDVSLSGLEEPPPPSRPDPRVEVDVAPARPGTVPPASRRMSDRPITAPPPSQDPSAGLTLTQRQSIPRVVKTPAEIAALPIDHRGGFLLGFVDGIQTLEEILDICAMPGPEALDLVVQLSHLGVIEFD